MNKKLQNILWGVFAIALIVIAVPWFLSSDLEHIEDTNGPDDYSLTTITDKDIIDCDMGSLNHKKETQPLFNDGITFSSDKFTGVEEIFVINYIGKSDFMLNVTSFEVTGGNFKMAVVHNGEIVATIEPDMFAECSLEDIKGTVALRIAGESAKFSFFLDKFTCDTFGITVD